MILIADSGSTKTHWCLCEGTNIIHQVITDGINPYYQTGDEIKSIVERKLLPEIKNHSVKSVCFYGAGCAFPEKKAIVSDAIGFHIQDVDIRIESDLVAACRALFHDKQGIACILGTGSNSCLYDGKAIVKNVPALGFILGDEGSGAVLGKRLISDCLKNQLPEELKNKLLEQYELTSEYILDRVYKQPFPNRFLAGFCHFLRDNIEHPAIYDIVYPEFDRFFKRNILQYPYKENKVGFVGSIAWYFRDILEKVASDNSVTLSAIMQSPMEGLVAFHAKNN